MVETGPKLGYDTFDDRTKVGCLKQGDSSRKEWHKYLCTLAILVEYVTNAMVVSLFAPAMVDFKYILRTSLTNVSYVYSFFSLGYIIGSLAGFSYQFVDKIKIFVLLGTVRIVFMAVLPFSSTLWQLYLTAFFLKLCISSFESGTYVMVIEMWSKYYSPVMHSTKLMYSLGMLLGATLDAPFLLGDVTKFRPDVHSLNSTTRDYINYSVDRRPKIAMPFLVGSALTAIIPITLCITYCLRTPTDDKNKEVTLEGETKAEKTASKSRLARRVTIICLALCTMITNGMVECHIIYSPTYYQYLPIGISATMAAHIVSIMSVFHAIGRFASIFESMVMSTETMIAMHLTVSMTALIILLIGQHSLWIILVGNALLGFGNSSLWTSFFIFTEKHLRLTENITSIYLFFNEFLLLFFPFILGPMIEWTPEIVLHTELILISINTLLFAFILVLNKFVFR